MSCPSASKRSLLPSRYKLRQRQQAEQQLEDARQIAEKLKAKLRELGVDPEDITG
ncbi:MAG: hypothetical protein AAGA75_26010 [Cyanobacteria bacterium P01_E01_bin.6]